MVRAHVLQHCLLSLVLGLDRLGGLWLGTKTSHHVDGRRRIRLLERERVAAWEAQRCRKRREGCEERKDGQHPRWRASQEDDEVKIFKAERVATFGVSHR